MSINLRASPAQHRPIAPASCRRSQVSAGTCDDFARSTCRASLNDPAILFARSATPVQAVNTLQTTAETILQRFPMIIEQSLNRLAHGIQATKCAGSLSQRSTGKSTRIWRRLCACCNQSRATMAQIFRNHCSTSLLDGGKRLSRFAKHEVKRCYAQVFNSINIR